MRYETFLGRIDGKRVTLIINLRGHQGHLDQVPHFTDKRTELCRGLEHISRWQNFLELDLGSPNFQDKCSSKSIISTGLQDWLIMKLLNCLTRALCILSARDRGDSRIGGRSKVIHWSQRTTAFKVKGAQR